MTQTGPPAATESHSIVIPDSKVHGANMGPIWGRQDPDGPHVGPMNLAIWVSDGHDQNVAGRLVAITVLKDYRSYYSTDPKDNTTNDPQMSRGILNKIITSIACISIRRQTSIPSDVRHSPCPIQHRNNWYLTVPLNSSGHSEATAVTAHVFNQRRPVTKFVI